MFVSVSDPVAAGLVESLARPGGNTTSIASMSELVGKQVELFKDLVPRLQRLLLLTDPTDPAARAPLLELHQGSKAPSASLCWYARSKPLFFLTAWAWRRGTRQKRGCNSSYSRQVFDAACGGGRS